MIYVIFAISMENAPLEPIRPFVFYMTCFASKRQALYDTYYMTFPKGCKLRLVSRVIEKTEVKEEEMKNKHGLEFGFVKKERQRGGAKEDA